jgi:hypothetical protein
VTGRTTIGKKMFAVVLSSFSLLKRRRDGVFLFVSSSFKSQLENMPKDLGMLAR